MKNTLKYVGGAILLGGLGFVAVGYVLSVSSVMSPRFEQVRRETFEQSKSYRQGMIQELQSMQFQYETASPEHKIALASIILRRAADFQDLPPDLQLFINQLKSNKQY